MTPERLRRIQAVFDAALDVPERERQAFVRGASGGDEVLAEGVLRLLAREQDPLEPDHTAAASEAIASCMALALGHELEPGQRVGPFLVQGRIGTGGMGRVFRAVRQEHGVEQPVAIKLIRAELGSPELLSRFTRERRLLASLDHPGICRLIDAGALPNGVPYVVMEFVDGVDLLTWCDRAGAGLRQRLQLFRQVVDAVSHAHRALVVHRDIKAGNVLVDAHGRPRLLDFGIAKDVGEGADAEQTGTAQRYFTPACAAPEQLLGGPVGVVADVYALGALLYQLLCGRPPLDLAGLSPGEVEHRVLRVPPPPMASQLRAADAAVARARGMPDVATLRRALRGDLDTIVQRCLRKDPAERYASAEQLDADLAAVLELRPIAARGGDRWYRFGKLVQRHRAAAALALALALALAMGGTALAIQAVALVEQHRQVLVERDRAEQAVQLLRQAFAAADPAGVLGGDVRVRHVLEAARPRLAALEQDQPADFAGLAATLAEVELATGLHQRGAALASRAARAAARAGSEADVVHRLFALAAMGHASAGETAEAEAAIEAALASHSQPTAALLVARSRLLRLADPQSALATAQAAVELVRDAPPTDETATAARWQLAEVLRASSRYGEALREVEHTLDWQRNGLPADNPAIALTRLRRAEILRNTGRLQEASDEARAVVAEIERTYGHETTFAALGQSILALVARGLDDRVAAMEHQRRALQAWESLAGETHTNTRRALFNLAGMQAAAGADDEGTERLYRQALERTLRVAPAGGNAAVHFRTGLARFLASRGRHGAALDALTPHETAAHLANVLEANRLDYLAVLEESWRAAGCPQDGRSAVACGAAAAVLRTFGPLGPRSPKG